jgi:hypothetical protein
MVKTTFSRSTGGFSPTGSSFTAVSGKSNESGMPGPDSLSEQREPGHHSGSTVILPTGRRVVRSWEAMNPKEKEVEVLIDAHCEAPIRFPVIVNPGANVLGMRLERSLIVVAG